MIESTSVAANGSFVSFILLGLCNNYPPSNDIVTETPPWQWVPETGFRMKNSNDFEFSCNLKNSDQIKKQMLKGRRFKIATIPERPPASWVTVGPNKTLIGHGIVFEILNTLSRKFEFTYDLYIPEKTTLRTVNGSVTHMLITGQVDMIAAFVPVLPNISKIKWGIELYHVEYVVLMKRPKESATGSGLLAPFEIEVWFLILISLTILGPIIHGIMALRSRLCGGSTVYSLGSCVWFVYGALMKQGSSLSPSSDSARIMFASWWLFIMILTSFYTANLTAFLTLSRFTLPIREVSDIANPMYRWVAPAGGAVEYSVDEEIELRPLRQSVREGRGSYINHNDYTKIQSLIADGVLLLHEKTWLNHYMLRIERKVRHEKDHCQYVLTTTPYLTRSLSFAYPENSILPHLFNEDMLLYVESGIVKHLINKELPEAVICPLNLGSKERQLRNSDLFTTYAIVMVGFILASMAFCFEIGQHLYNRQLNMKNNVKSGDEPEIPSRLHKNNPRLIKCQNSLEMRYGIMSRMKFSNITNNSRHFLNKFSSGSRKNSVVPAIAPPMLQHRF